MKRLIYIFTVLLSLLSCIREDFVISGTDDVPDGYVKVTFGANIAEARNVHTKAIDPDGLGVNNMTLFCFNEFGLYITESVATLKSHDSESGIYEAIIPEHTFIIHFLANQSEGLYDSSEFPGQTENMVIANMEGGSGMMIYWSRFQKDPSSDKSITEQLGDLSFIIDGTTYIGVKLIRNQAKISIKDWNTSNFTVTGFRTVNIPAFGTVAPHHPTRHFNIVEDWESITEDFVTLPDNLVKMSDIVDINTKPEDYIFETRNSGDNLVSVIIKGKNAGSSEELYYRVVMQDENGDSFMIRRNHNYILNITGKLTYGKKTFDEALEAPATNNVWISIDDWVNEVSDSEHTLSVDKTSIVLSSDEYAGTNYTISYKLTKRSGGGAASAPSITWIDNNVAYSNFVSSSYNTSNGEGQVTISLHPMNEDNQQQSGKLLFKYGKLQRTVEIIVIRTQKFTPSWIAAQVFSEHAGENVTLMFTIPDTCPESLFPFSVLISSNHLDIRSESGQQLPVLKEGNEGYFGENFEGIDYKYEYTVTGPGKHRIFMRTILTHEDEDMEEVHIEAEFFETITKTVVFAGYHSKSIFVENLQTYGNHYADDEALYYMLVPQKKASPIVMTVALKEKNSNGDYVSINHADKSNIDQWHKNGNDEFLVYSKYLSVYNDYFASDPDRYSMIEDQAWETDMVIIDEDSWSINGRVMAMRTFSNTEESPKYGLQSDGTYDLYMLTNSANQTDVIRIASNNNLSKYAFSEDRIGNPYGESMYAGNEYRSTIFDMGLYKPFRFAAEIELSEAGSGHNHKYGTVMSNQEHNTAPEVIDTISLNYVPGHKMDILLDVTSFTGSDGMSVHPFGNLFGEAFDIYIDAPMLEIDKSRLAACNLTAEKLRKDPAVPGRFIYTVDRYRDQERIYGVAPARNSDTAVKEYDDFGRKVNAPGGIDQNGERKRLPFIQSSITAKGKIIISADSQTVTYQPKTFQLLTEHIMGKIRYRKDGVDIDIPKDAFVAFARLRTAARIGVVTMYETGQFELNLREEYKYEWDDDPIEFDYTDDEGNVYDYKLDSLKDLFEMTQKGETIILTPAVAD